MVTTISSGIGHTARREKNQQQRWRVVKTSKIDGERVGLVLVVGENRLAYLHICRFADWRSGMRERHKRACYLARPLLNTVWSAVGVAFCLEEAIRARSALRRVES